MTAFRLILLVLLSALVLPARAADPAVAFAGFLTGDADRARLAIEFDRRIDARLRFSAEPMRVVVELPPTAFRLGGELEPDGTPIVAAIGFDQTDDMASRVLIELDAPVRVARQVVEPREDGQRSRLVVDLVRADARDFAALVRSAPVRPAVQKVEPKAASEGAQPLIVLDPGHGGVDGGAVGRRRTIEKNVTMAFARTLRDKLLATKRFRVRLTRERDRFVSLERRVEIAREAEASLLLSIHADSLRQRRIRGSTIYTLSDTASDAVSKELATDQNRADLAAGLQAPKLDTQAADILFDLMQRETAAISTTVSRRVVNALGAATRLIGNPNRSADFFVLRAPDVPSVLVELGYLSNVEDEKLLNSADWREKVADAITSALVAHFDGEPVAAR